MEVNGAKYTIYSFPDVKGVGDSVRERMVVISGLRNPFREDILGNTDSLLSFRTPNS
jgi:hypothetical protein